MNIKRNSGWPLFNTQKDQGKAYYWNITGRWQSTVQGRQFMVFGNNWLMWSSEFIVVSSTCQTHQNKLNNRNPVVPICIFIMVLHWCTFLLLTIFFIISTHTKLPNRDFCSSAVIVWNLNGHTSNHFMIEENKKIAVIMSVQWICAECW